jgi:hypothetical protein
MEGGGGGRKRRKEEGRRMACCACVRSRALAVRKRCGCERRAHSFPHATFLNCVRRTTLGFLEPGNDTSEEG